MASDVATMAIYPGKNFIQEISRMSALLRFNRICFVIALSCTLVLSAPPHRSAAAPENQPEDAAKVDAATKKLMAANGFFKQGMYDLAAEEYTEFLDNYPNHEHAGRARYGLAVCLYRTGEYKKAIGHLRSVLKDRDFEHRDEALAVLGHSLLEEGEHKEALSAFDELLRKYPTSKHNQFAAACRIQTLYKMDKPQVAADACRSFIKKHSKSGYRPTVEYYLALSLSSSAKYAEAVDVLDGFLKNYTNSPYAADAMLLMGQCLENQDQLDAAAEQYRKMASSAPPPRRSEAVYSLGLVLFESQKYEKAIEQLTVILKKYPDSSYAAPARLQLGLAQYEASQYEQARKTLSEVVKKDEKRAGRAKYWQARCDMSQKKYESARKILDELDGSEHAGKNAAAIAYDRANCAMAMSQYEQAAGEFKNFSQRFPKSKLVHEAAYNHAYCLHQLKNYQQSLSACREVAKSAEGTIKREAEELAAENLFMMDKYEEAAGAFKGLISSAGDDEDTLRLKFRLAQCEYLRQRLDEAIKLLGELAGNKKVVEDEVMREAVFLLGDARLQKKQYDQAAEALEKYVGLDADRKTEGRYKLAISRLRGEKPEAAGKIFDDLMKGSEDSPWTARAAFEYGQYLYHNDGHDKAAKSLSRALECKPPEQISAPAMYLLAWIDKDAGENESAAKRFADMAGKYPEHKLAEDAEFQHGMCLRRAGQNAKAVDALKDYVKRYPEGKHCTEARKHIGICLAEEGEYEKAVQVFSELVGNDKTRTSEVFYELAWSQRELNQPDKAAETYRRLIKEFPKSDLVTRTRAELAEVLHNQEKSAEAAELLKKVVSVKDADKKLLSGAMYRLGLCYQAMKEDAKAADTFASFAQKFPKDPNATSALYQAGAAYGKISDYDKAEKFLKMLIAGDAGEELDASARLKLGEVLASAEKYESSENTYRQFLKSYPKHRYAYLAGFGVGWALENRQQYDKARQWYVKVTDTHNGPTAARSQFQIGECWFAQGKYERAARELLKVHLVYDYPQWSARSLYEAGRAFEQQKKYFRAKEQYKLCAKKYKDSDSAAMAQKRLKALESIEGG